MELNKGSKGFFLGTTFNLSPILKSVSITKSAFCGLFTNHCCPVKKLYFMNHLVFIGSVINLTNYLVFEFFRKVTKSQKIKPINIRRLSVFARLFKHNLREIIFYRILMFKKI